MPKTTEVKKILVVDDEESVRELVKICLEKGGKGHEVTLACNAPEALEILQKDKDFDLFDLIITDCRMPGLSGNDLIQTVQSKNPKQSFLMMSGTLPENRIVPSIEKPFTVQKLFLAVSSALSFPAK